jgi:hypothetical protein
MSVGRALLVCVAAFHLILVAIGAAGAFPFLGTAGRAAGWYGAVSGAGMGYSFFAPVVGAQLRARFVLSGDGRSWEDDLLSGHNQEVKLRVGGAINLYPTSEEDELLREDLLACWSAAMFARHPDASKVTIYMEAFEVPTMADYRAGARPAWVPVHVAVFTRLPKTSERSDP